MAGGPSEIKPPNSHPSNPIHKQATEAQGLAEKKPKPKHLRHAPAISTTVQTPVTADTSQELTKTESVDSHHVNKTLVVVGALACVGLIVYASS